MKVTAIKTVRKGQTRNAYGHDNQRISVQFLLLLVVSGCICKLEG